MRISDWSSDVCSSDLLLGAGPAAAEGLVTLRDAAVVEDEVVRLSDLFDGIGDPALAGTPVAQAPEPGVSVDVGARWLYAVAQAHALEWEPRSRYERPALRRTSHDVTRSATRRLGNAFVHTCRSIV